MIIIVRDELEGYYWLNQLIIIFFSDFNVLNNLVISYHISFADSPYKSLIDSAILALQESGQLFELKKKWWEEEDSNKNCKVFLLSF